MATESPFVYDDTFIAAIDLSALQYYVVSSSAAGYVSLCVASSGADSVVTRPFGILQNAPTSGHAAQVRILGKSKAVASSTASITQGHYLACSTAGTLMTATTGCVVLGPAASGSSSVAGQLVEVYLLGPFLYQTAGATA